MILNNNLLSNWSKTPCKNYIYLSFSISVLLVFGIIILQNNLPPSLPLFYGKPAGEGVLTNLRGFLIAPLLAFLITLANTLISFIFKDIFIKKILILTSLLVTILISITIIKIIALVGFF